MWRYRRLPALLLTGVLCLSLCACGRLKSGPDAAGSSVISGESHGQGNSGGEITFLKTEGEELFCYTEESSVTVQGEPCMTLYEDCLYYGMGQALMCYSPVDKSLSFRMLQWEDAPAAWNLYQIAFGIDGSIYGVAVAKQASVFIRTYVCRFSSTGELVYAHELTEDLDRNDMKTWSESWSVGVDAEGRFYLADDDLIWIVSADGTVKEAISFDRTSDFTIGDMARTGDGRLHVAYSGGTIKKYYIGELTPDFVGSGNEDTVSHQEKVAIVGIEALGEKELLVYDQSAVYCYDLAAQTFEELFTWEKAGVDGSRVVYGGCLSDGRVVVVTYKGSTRVSVVEISEE